ncbi:hypothetical protein Poli38472_009483 [Pythium oligandrum]|uniref:Uncharacterized protein n=1 Tax=Pythium oligandrum TaxID=41045 RepID=A0A8K1CF01_PYTOL|nr:hypothetical protein Poli38472_009483 [Pythium oligandrum]|eukprot:TMW61990.1 hypothetical protein Poli38472_009483 [Pythium oligandrum]
MKIVSIQLLRQDASGGEPTILSAGYEVSSFGYFQRSGIREMINFFSKTFIKRTPAGQRQSVQHEDYYCHVFVRRDGLSGIVVADQEYPPRVAFALLNKLLDDYDKETRGAWQSAAGPQDWAPLTTALSEYQDPSKADKISAIQKELDETTAVLSKTIDNVLERGEKLDDLVAKSQDLSTQSKVFYKQAKKTNSCCIVIFVLDLLKYQSDAPAMKLFAILLLRQEEHDAESSLLTAAYDPSTSCDLGTTIDSNSKELVKLAAASENRSEQREGYFYHARARTDGLSGVVVADPEYPRHVAFSVLDKLLSDYDKEEWELVMPTRRQERTPVTTALSECQDLSTAIEFSGFQDKRYSIEEDLLLKTIDFDRLFHTPLVRSESQMRALELAAVQFRRQQKPQSWCLVM